MVTLTWHVCKYKVHKLHQRYILKNIKMTYIDAHLNQQYL